MNDFERRKIRETFSRLFVVAINNQINLYSFTSLLERSELASKIEKDIYDPIFEMPIDNLFYSITGFKNQQSSGYGIYNDAYWAGQNYFDLQYRLKKSFSFIFLKLPFDELLNIYLIYHEMDLTSLVEYFERKDSEKTILRLLCERERCSLNDVSKETGIPLSTLKKYNTDDDFLYNASFQTVSKIVGYFGVNYPLFIK